MPIPPGPGLGRRLAKPSIVQPLEALFRMALDDQRRKVRSLTPRISPASAWLSSPRPASPNRLEASSASILAAPLSVCIFAPSFGAIQKPDRSCATRTGHIVCYRHRHLQTLSSSRGGTKMSTKQMPATPATVLAGHLRLVWPGNGLHGRRRSAPCCSGTSCASAAISTTSIWPRSRRTRLRFQLGDPPLHQLAMGQSRR